MLRNGRHYISRQLKLYDVNGKELASGEFFGEQKNIPVDIALSYDAKKMAVDMIDVSGGKTDSVISFYNFGSVGQNEIDNNVGTYKYENQLIPEIAYVSDSRMIAVSDQSIMVFDGSHFSCFISQERETDGKKPQVWSLPTIEEPSPRMETERLYLLYKV